VSRVDIAGGATDPPQGAEVLPAPSTSGSVVTELGGDVGAIVVRFAPGWSGREIEITRAGTPWHGSHVAVRARHLPGGTLYAAFFEVQRGDHLVRPKGGGPVRAVSVAGGTVNTLDWDVAGPHFEP